MTCTAWPSSSSVTLTGDASTTPTHTSCSVALVNGDTTAPPRTVSDTTGGTVSTVVCTAAYGGGCALPAPSTAETSNV